MLTIIIAILTAYLVGAIPTSYIIAKLIRGVDIRNYGSGNVGATNLMRIAGRWPGAIALFLDIAKGVIAVTILPFVFLRNGLRLDFDIFRYLLGLAAICGHIWPVFLRFKGGKGVATSAGVVMIVAPKVFGIGLSVGLLTIGITRFVSLGSIIGAISIPIVASILGRPLKLIIFLVILCIITSYKHRSNIRRLLRNEEAKVGQKVKVK